MIEIIAIGRFWQRLRKEGSCQGRFKDFSVDLALRRQQTIVVMGQIGHRLGPLIDEPTSRSGVAADDHIVFAKPSHVRHAA